MTIFEAETIQSKTGSMQASYKLKEALRTFMIVAAEVQFTLS